MKDITTKAMKSVYGRIDQNKKNNTFEAFFDNLDIWVRFYDR